MSDDDSDDWGKEELVLNAPAKQEEPPANNDDEDNAGDDEGWDIPAPAPAPAPTVSEPPSSSGEAMIIVDITKLDENIHSKLDRNSVNDPQGASTWRKTIESNYEMYAKHAEFLASGTITPVGMTVWKEALVRLRDDRPGHYFLPIFPPKENMSS